MELKRYDLSCILGCGEKCTVRVGEGEEYVKYADVEKALKLWDIVRIPEGKSCYGKNSYGCKMMSVTIEGHIRHYCDIFNKEVCGDKCKECIDIFGGE